MYRALLSTYTLVLEQTTKLDMRGTSPRSVHSIRLRVESRYSYGQAGVYRYSAREAVVVRQ